MRNVFDWEMTKKPILDVLVRSVMSIYETKIRVRVDPELSEKFDVNVGMH